MGIFFLSILNFSDKFHLDYSSSSPFVILLVVSNSSLPIMVLAGTGVSLAPPPLSVHWGPGYYSKL